MLHFCARVSYFFATARRYEIKSLTYLVQTPPTRPPTAFNLYCKEQTTGKKGISATEQMKKVSEKWNSLSKEQKSKYEKYAAEWNPNYESEK